MRMPRAALVSCFLVAVSCAPPATHRYPRSPVRPADLVGAWTSRLHAKTFVDASRADVVAVTLSGHATIWLEQAGRFSFRFVQESDSNSVPAHGRWSLCTRDVGRSRQLQALCLDSLVFMGNGSADTARATRIPDLVLEGDRDELLLCDPDEDRMLCFSREPRRRAMPR